jgi:replicative DNA helicase
MLDDAPEDPLVDLAAERALLGAVLLDLNQQDGTFERIRRIVRVSRSTRAGQVSYDGDFSDPRHNVIFACMGVVLSRGEPIDVLTVSDELRVAHGPGRAGLLNTVGGSQYIGDLSSEVTTTAHCESHARIVAEHAAARRLRDACRDSLLLLKRGPRAARDALALLASVHVERRGKAVRSMRDVVISAWQQYEDVLDRRRLPVPTGFAALDGDERQPGLFAGGLHRGELVVIAADQAGGKTAFALQLAAAAATPGLSVLIISQEMNAESLHWRMACSLAGVDGTHVRAGLLSQDELNAVQTASDRLANLDLRICDAGCSAEEIRVAALACQGERPLHLVIVDYLQILDAPEAGDEVKQHELIDHNAKAMKKLARELDCPVVLLSQFNRSGQNAGRKPRIQDLKGSGGIESHADVILVIYPEGGRGDGPPPPRMDVELLVLKQRSGPTDSVPLVFERQYTRFTERVVRREGAVPPSAPDDDMPEGA